LRSYGEVYGPLRKIVTEGLTDPMPKTVVFRCFELADSHDPVRNEICGGLGDRFAGLVSVFSVALQHNLPMLIEWPAAAQSMEPALADLVDWRPPTGYLEAARSSAPPSDWLYNLVNAECIVGSNKIKWDGVRTPSIALKSNRACVNRAFYPRGEDLNETTGELLAEAAYLRDFRVVLEREWGLTGETAFGCLLGALVAPSEQVVKKFSRVIREILDPGNFFVGVHIRTGDAEMGAAAQRQPTSSLLSRYTPAFEAALRLGEQRAGHGQIVRIFLATDSWALKQEASLVYGTDLLLTTAVEPSHVAARDVRGPLPVTGKIATPLQANVDSFGEWWLLSLCGAFSIGGSGFSHSASAVALRHDAIHVYEELGSRSGGAGAQLPTEWARGSGEGGGAGSPDGIAAAAAAVFLNDTAAAVETQPWTTGG